MSRTIARTTTRTVAIATVLTAVLLAAVVTALGSRDTADASPAAARLSLAGSGTHRVTWLTELGSFSLDAPRGWRTTRPAESTGRVTGPDSTRLSLTELDGRQTVTEAAATRAADVEGLDQAHLLDLRQVEVTLTSGPWKGIELTLGSVDYRYRDSAGRARRVVTTMIGVDVQQGEPRASYALTGSGPASDGLAVRDLVDRTVLSVFWTP